MSSSDKPKDCGFFSGIFGGASGGDSSTKTEKCISCGSGMQECACNTILKEHLKNCCGYGTLPKLIEKCEETPGYKNPADIKYSSCADGGPCGASKSAVNSVKDGCGPPKKDDCAPPADAKLTAGSVSDKDCKSDKDKCSGGGGSVYCRPMPESDCNGCKPSWMICPPSITIKTYTAPENDRILPLSTGGRMGGGCGEASKCAGCGTDKGPPGKPKISAGCPMNRGGCGSATKEADSIFSKIAAFFKAADDPSLCHRDVFNPSLVVRDDGYMCPLLEKVVCAGNSDPCGCVEVEKPACVEEVVEEIIETEEICEEVEEEVEELCEEELVEVEESCDEEIVEEVEEPCVEEVVENAEELCVEDEEEVATSSPPAVDCCACCEELKKAAAVAVPEEDECVEDSEGECVEEDTDECVEDECLEFEPEPVPNFNIKKASNCPPIEQVPGICPECGGSGNECCSPQNKFVQRVVAPFADEQQQSCDTILKDMRTPKSPQYEEPQPIVDCPPEPVVEVNNNSVPEPPLVESCPEAPLPPPPAVVSASCNSPPPPPPVVVCDSPPPPPPPVYQPAAEATCNSRCGASSCYEPCVDPYVANPNEYEYEARPLNFCTFPAAQQCPVAHPPPQIVVQQTLTPEPVPVAAPCAPAPSSPPAGTSLMATGPSTCPCGAYKIETPMETPKPCEAIETPKDSSAVEVAGPPPKCGSSSAQAPPTCAQLSQEESCTCGPGADGGSEAGQWKPTPRGGCPYCGAAQRGDTEACLICQLTRKMNDPNYVEPPCEEKEDPSAAAASSIEEDAKSKAAANKCYSDAFDMNPNGTPKYEGGMCLERSLRYLSKANPRKNELETMALDTQTFQGYESSGADCTTNSESEEVGKRKKYEGGMDIAKAKEFIWSWTTGK